MKKALILVLTVVALITAFTVTAFAQEAKIGGTPFDTLKEAVSAANEGDEIVLLDDVSLNAILTIDKPITLNGNGKTLTSTAARAINVETTGSVTIKNLTINAGERAINIINQPVNVTISGVTATAKNNAVMLATSSDNSVLVIEDCYLSGLATVNIAGPNAAVTITDTDIINNDNTEKETYGAITVYDTATNATVVTVNGGSISVMDDSKAVANFPSATVTFNGTAGTLDSHNVVAMVGIGGYTTLADAINGAKGETIKLVSDIVLTETLVIAKDKNVTIDLNGHNITYLVEAATGNTYAIENNGTLTVKDTSESQNGEICLTYTGASVNHSISTICNRGTVNVVSGGINAVSGNQYISYAIDNNNTISDAVINVSGGYVIGGASDYSIRLYANSTKNENALNVTGGTIYFVWLQAPNASANKASISVSGGLTYYVYVGTADGSVADCSNYKVSLDSEYMEYEPYFGALKEGYYVDNKDGVYEIRKYAQLEDVFTFKGYSYELETKRIVAGYTVNHESLNTYVKENNYASYDFGAVFTAYEIGDNAIEKSLVSDNATKNYLVFISDVTEEYYDLELIACMYVSLDGEKKYITESNKKTVFVDADKVTAITVNQIIGGNK